MARALLWHACTRFAPVGGWRSGAGRAIRWRRSAGAGLSTPDRSPRVAPAKSAAQSEETASSTAAARCAIATGAAASAAARLRPHTNSPAAAHIGKRPGTRPTPQRPRRNAEESTWQKAARAGKEETRPKKQIRHKKNPDPRPKPI